VVQPPSPCVGSCPLSYTRSRKLPQLSYCQPKGVADEVSVAIPIREGTASYRNEVGEDQSHLNFHREPDRVGCRPIDVLIAYDGNPSRNSREGPPT
jgi:hypothetical protein